MVFTIRAIIEIMGFPEEHVKEVTKKVIERLKKEDGITVIKETLHEPQIVKEKFFSCFVELEIKLHDFSKVLNFCYDYLPSSIEILDVEKVNISVREFSFGLNEMLEKLHNYNFVVNNLNAKINMLEKKENQ